MADELVRYEGTKETVGLPPILAGSMPAEVRGRVGDFFASVAELGQGEALEREIATIEREDQVSPASIWLTIAELDLQCSSWSTTSFSKRPSWSTRRTGVENY